MFHYTRFFVLICTVSYSLGAAAAPVQAEAPVPLIARYAMEPDSARPASLRDSGALGINGHINGGVKYDPDGHKGYALRFTGEQDGTARVEDPKLLNRIGAPLSVCLWIKPESWAKSQAYAALLTKTSQSWIGKPFAFAIGDNANLGFVGENAGGWSGPVLKMGAWQHVAFTYQPNGDRILYLNGQEVNRAKAGNDLPNNEEPLIFGSENGYDYPGGYRSKYKGLIDEVSLYAAALTPEQIKADMNGTLAVRAATPADFAPKTQYVTLHLVRADIPLGDKPRNGHSRQFAYRTPGPDAVDWPAFHLKIDATQSREIWKNGAEDGVVLPCREGREGHNMFRQPTDPVLSPGNHWLRAFKWAIWGRRFVHTTDPSVRMDGTTYELWTFPVKIQGEGTGDIQRVVLKAEGEIIYARTEALHSLTLLLPQNQAGHPYELTINNRPPVSFAVGIAPVKLGDPKDGFILFSHVLSGKGAKITVAALSHPDAFPYQKEWQDDTLAVAQAKAYAQAVQNGEKSKIPPSADGGLKTRAILAAANPLPAPFLYKREADWTQRVGVEVPRSPETVYAMSLTHGMSGGFRYYAEQGPRYVGSMEDYARYLAELGLDLDFEQSGDGAFGNPNDPNSYENWLAALAKNGVKGGLNNVNLNDPHQSLYSYTLADFHAPKYRDAQIVAQRFAAFPNFAGENMGADNACYTWYWDWAGPEPTKFWGEAVAVLLGDNGTKTLQTPMAPGMPPDKAHEAAGTEKEFLEYVAKYDAAFRQYGYLAQGVQEIAPDLLLLTGSFGSSPGVGGSGGYPWSIAPGKPMFAGMSALQTYDWNELPSSKPMHNEALMDRLRSWYPNKPGYALLDNFGLFFRREPMQRQFALALTRGVKAVGTQFLPNRDNTKDKPGVAEAYRETARWVHKYGGAYAMTEPLPAIGILFVEGQAVSRRTAYTVRGPQEGKTTEALFLCHAAGWPAKIITPEELKRGLPAGMRAILLVGLNKLDATWNWYDGLTPDLQRFVTAGGRILTDDESVSPLPATATKMKIVAYIPQSETDASPLLFERNKANIAALRKAMAGIAPPFAASDEPTVWAVPTIAGDVQYLTVVNWGSEEGKNASQVIRPQVGLLTWKTDRPIYDVRLGRKISPEEAAKCDLTREGFQYYALPPAEIAAPKIVTTAGTDGYFVANVTIGAKPIRGVPVQIDITQGGRTVTLYSATGLQAKLPVKWSDAPGTFQVKVTELLSGLTGETTFKTGGNRSASNAVAPATEREKNALVKFAARKSVPLTVALTPEQAANPQTLALAKKLTAYYEAQGRKVRIGKIEPNDVVLTVQPLQSVQYFPRWKTVDSDLVLLGSPQDNLLLLDEARGFLLPAEALRLAAGQAYVGVVFSPFVGERQVVNLVANDAAGLQAGINRLLETKTKRDRAQH